MKQNPPRPLDEKASDSEKIAFLLGVIDCLQKEAAENRLLKKTGYAGAGLSGGASALGSNIPDIAQLFPASIDPTQLWYVVPILLLFSLSMKGIEAYEEKQVKEAKKTIEILEKKKNSQSEDLKP